jgi:protein-tyrosine phosphatase
MLRMAAEGGTTALFATPHTITGSWLPTWDVILQQVSLLNQYAADACLNIVVYPGAEVAMDWGLLDLLPSPGQYCLGGGRFILVELPLGSLPTYADEFLFTLQARDFVPILGHPERNPDVKKDPARLQPWIDAGIFVQMNASSLMGTMGSHTQQAAMALLERGQVHFIGSDAHGVGVRRPDLREASALLRKLLGSEGARQLLQKNPERLLRNQPDEIEAPRAPKRPKQGWAAKIQSLWRKNK